MSACLWAEMMVNVTQSLLGIDLETAKENQLVCMLVDTMARGMGVRFDLVPRMGLLLEIRCILL